MKIVTKALFPSFLLFFASAESAYAYLDPGTGSLIIQGLIAGIAAIGGVLSMYWQKIKILFDKKKQDTSE